MRDTALTNPERSRWIKDFAAVLVMLRDRAREQRTIADQLPIDSIAGRPDNGARHPGCLRGFVLLKRDCLYCCCGTPNKNRGATAYDHGFWLPRARLVERGTDEVLPGSWSSR